MFNKIIINNCYSGEVWSKIYPELQQIALIWITSVHLYINCIYGNMRINALKINNLINYIMRLNINKNWFMFGVNLQKGLPILEAYQMVPILW